jgi:hypothetical protein
MELSKQNIQPNEVACPGCSTAKESIMPARSSAMARARLLELLVRTAFVPDAKRERHLTDWCALRYFSQAGLAGRTRPGLANYIGVPPSSADAIVQRLQDSGDLEDGPANNALELTREGQSVLANDPLAPLSAAIATLPETDQQKLGTLLETTLAALTARQNVQS